MKLRTGCDFEVKSSYRASQAVVSPFETLPTELLWKICASLSTIELKALRLCSRKLSIPACEYLFSDVNLFTLKESFTKLKFISNHQHLANNVRTLTCWLPFFGHAHCWSFEGFSRNVATVYHHGKIPETDAVDSSKRFYREFLKYLDYFKEQEKLLTSFKALDLITAALKQMPRLKKIRFARMPHGTILQSMNSPTPSGLTERLGRETLCGVYYSEGIRSSQRLSADQFQDLILRALGLSGVALCSLELGHSVHHNVGQKFGMFLPSSWGSPAWPRSLAPSIEFALSKIENLCIGILPESTTPLPEWSWDPLPGLFDDLKALKNLHLIVYNPPLGPKRSFESCSHLFTNCHWPVIETLDLEGLNFSDNGLERILARHNQTLRKVRLAEVFLSGETAWEKCLSELLQCPRLMDSIKCARFRGQLDLGQDTCFLHSLGEEKIDSEGSATYSEIKAGEARRYIYRETDFLERSPLAFNMDSP
ncbi:MAG: hypothetical protein M4579_000329 [Chaenotheca gracillima]|nr:MAG: hypothetical protein M4579_000329 [Chaenotheca gracillima]